MAAVRMSSSKSLDPLVPEIANCMSWKQVEAGEPCSTKFLRQDKRPLRQPAPGEVLVQVMACSLNPVDARICQGLVPSVSTPPLVPGSDFAGVVVGAAPDAPFTKGDKVFGYSPNRYGRKRDIAAAATSRTAASYLDAIGGALSDFIICPEQYLTLMPDNIDFQSAAALPTVGMTCFDILELLPNQLNYCVVILGAAGGVGTLLTQLCAARGYRVWAVTREENFAQCKALGANFCVDYTKRSWDQYFIPESGKEPWVDAVIDVSPDGTGANWQLSKTVLVKSGTYASLTWQDPEAGEDAGASIASYWQSAYRNVLSQFYFKYVQMTPSKEKLNKLCDFMSQGHMKPVIDSVYGFDDIHAAFEKVMSKRAHGKVVISWDDEDVQRQALESSVSLPTIVPAEDISLNVDNKENSVAPPRRKVSVNGQDVPYVATTTTTYGDNRPDLPDLDDDASPNDKVTYSAAAPKAVPAPASVVPVGMAINEHANSNEARARTNSGGNSDKSADFVQGQLVDSD